MIQTDPLSLVFIACFVFAGAFLVASLLLGMGHTHTGLHLHAGHVHLGHTGAHLHLGHAAATGAHTATGHPARVTLPHADGQSAQVPPQATTPAPTPMAWLLGEVNLNAILVFLLAFGLLGYLLHNAAHAGAVLTIMLAVMAGVGGAIGINAWFARLFGNEIGGLGLDSSQMEGRLATVTLPIRVGGIGEVVFTGENGTRRSLGARSADGTPIPRDAEVVILTYENGIAAVQTWDNFIASTQPT
jgi:hypothetical protein